MIPLKYIVLVFVIIIMFIYYTAEHFQVIGHNGQIDLSRIDSIPAHTKISDKYVNNYYFEFTDKEFEKIIKSIFKKTKYPNNIKSYDDLINFLNVTLKNSKELKDIQIVQDRLINNEHIEILLYRENKYQGKHLILDITQNWEIKDIRVIGSISEDKIALFPIFPMDPTDNNALIITNNISDYDTKIIPEYQSSSEAWKNKIVVKNNAEKTKLLNNSSLFNNDSNTIMNTNNVQIDPRVSQNITSTKFALV